MADLRVPGPVRKAFDTIPQRPLIFENVVPMQISGTALINAQTFEIAGISALDSLSGPSTLLSDADRVLEQSRTRLSELSGKGAFVFKLGGSVTGNNISNVNDPELAIIWQQLARELVFLLETKLFP